MLIRPATGHTAHDRQCILGRGATMFAGSWLAHAQLGVLASTPMNGEHNLARIIVDIDDDVRDQSPQ
jgi:hypothetical protein